MDLGEKLIGLVQLLQHEAERRIVIASSLDVRWDIPQLHELPVHLDHVSALIHDQNAVSRRFQCGRQHRERVVLLFLGALAIRERHLHPLEAITELD